MGFFKSLAGLDPGMIAALGGATGLGIAKDPALLALLGGATGAGVGGLLSGKGQTKPEQTFGGGFDPGTGQMSAAVQPFSIEGRVSPELQATIPDAQPAKKRGFLGSGMSGREALGTALGYIGDSLTGKDNFAQQMAHQRKSSMDEQQYQRRRQDEMADWQAKQLWTRNNPAAINNDTVNDYQFILQNYGRAAADKFITNTKIDPIRYIPTPDGRMMAVGGVMPQQSQDNIPTIEDGYQYTPGPGGRANQGNWKPIGGASPSNGSSGFPRPY